MLHRSQASKNTINLNCQSCTQCFSFLHRVSCQNYWWLLSLSRQSWNHVPHESSCFWIHSCWWLIQKHNGRITNHGNSNLKFSFITTRIGSSTNILKFFEIHFNQFLFNEFSSELKWNSFDGSKKFKMFFGSQKLKKSIKLWTISNITSCISHVICNIMSHNVGLTSSRRNFSC